MFINHVIVEAQNYEEMFNDIFKLDPNSNLRRQITADIEWARRTLKKNDRIVWFLRWSKVWYLLSGGIWSGGRADPSLSGALQQYNRRFDATHVPGDLVSLP